MSVLIKGMEMPMQCVSCKLWTMQIIGGKGYDICRAVDKVIKQPYGRQDFCPLVPVPEHGRLIDADALIDDLKRQCKEVFRVNAVSPDDFWITRNEAYNERLWGTWCESFYGYLQTRPTVIPAEEGE